MVLERFLGLMQVTRGVLHEVAIKPQALLCAELASAVGGFRPADGGLVLVLVNPVGNSLPGFAKDLGNERCRVVQEEVSVKGVVNCVRVSMP